MKIGNTGTYVRIAYDATVDHIILDQMFPKNLRVSLNDPSKVFEILNNSNKMLNSFYISVVFSAFTIESFLNNYGDTRLDDNFYYENLDKLPIRNKWIVLLKLINGKEVVKGKEPFQSIHRLFHKRDEIVHDKPKEITKIEEVKKIKKRSPYRIMEFFNTIVAIHDYLNEIDDKYINSPIISDMYYRWWKDWNSPQKPFTPEKGLPFENAKFPNLKQYKIAVNRFYGSAYDITKYKADIKNHKIKQL